MNEERLKTLKEVADQLDRPPHRIIHVCETGVVRPTVEAEGRGSVRRFGREDVFRVRLALDLQDAGVRLPLIKPLMRALDWFMESYEVQMLQAEVSPFDLVSVIDRISSSREPMRAYLMPPNHVTLLVPGFAVTAHRGSRLQFLAGENEVSWPAVTIVANLTLITAGL